MSRSFRPVAMERGGVADSLPNMAAAMGGRT